jgi:diguanylate cyclase (GGDEF)-like protein/PAS domain S-box-containing protein
MGRRHDVQAFGESVCRARAVNCLIALLLFSVSAASQAPQIPARLPTLQTVHDVFALSKTEAARCYPIKLDAIVTYSDPEWGILFVQDRTGATYINVHGKRTTYTPGQRIQVHAVTSDGENGTEIADVRISLLGFGPVPRPAVKTVAELDLTDAESHLAVTEGVLRPCDEATSHVCFQLFDGAKRIWLVTPQATGLAAQAVIGARVRATGVVGRHEDIAKKRLGAQLFAENLESIKVLDPPAPVGAASPPTPIGAVSSAEADARFVYQVHVRGTVIWSSPGQFAIQDATGTIFASPAFGDSARTGSSVDVIGFPSHGAFGLEIADASVSLAAVQAGGIQQPLQVGAEEILRRSLDGRRVRVKARLIAQNANQAEFVYQLQDGGQQFNAVLLRGSDRGEIVGLARDAKVQLTGVAFIQHANPEWPDSLLILIESPSDIVVAGGMGWLTPQRGLAIFGLMAICVLVPLLWVTSLRRTVHSQTAVIRARLESEVHLESRFRRLFERNLAAVFTWRPDGTIVDCNLAFVRMLGLRTREETIGRNYWDMEADAALAERLKSALHGQALSNIDASLRRDDGGIVYQLQNITPVDGADGEVYETTAIDVTLIKEKEAELQKAKDTAVHESLIDSLTKLPNRRYLMETLPSSLENARREGRSLGLLYLDLDGFKLVNDSLGHLVGDELLVQVAACFRSWIRDGDTLARLGGDEFLVILNGLQMKQEAMLVAENLLDVISSSFQVKGHELAIGASIGVSIFPDDTTDAEELLQQADSAMYAAKRAGKNRAARYTREIGSQVHERSTLENLLRGALARKEIFVHYQPEFDLATRRLLRFEALARWTHPVIGAISPSKFIPIAEESGTICAIGANVMEQACVEAVRWQRAAEQPIQVAVNVSGIQLRRKGFVEGVRQVLDRSGLPPELLQIEVTESIMLGEGQHAVEIMSQLNEMGISLAIDDFGTGYSNLSYLPSLPFNTLKIDGTFIRNLEEKPEGPAMIRTMISLAHDIGMRVIVEGVETVDQLKLIEALGANEAQGFLLGRPVANPLEEYLISAMQAI